MSVFISDAQLQQALADSLGIDVATQPTRWARIVANANASAYLDIRGALLQRGFQASQVDSWDRGPEFNMAIGIYWALVTGAGLHSYDDRFIKLQDRRPELMSVLVELSGTPGPPTGTPGAVDSGGIAISCHEQYRLRQFAGQGRPLGGLYGPDNEDYWTGNLYTG